MFESSECPDLAGSEERASYVYGWAVEKLVVIVFSFRVLEVLRREVFACARQFSFHIGPIGLHGRDERRIRGADGGRSALRNPQGFQRRSVLGVPPGTLSTGHQRRRSVPDVHPGALRIGRRNVATVFCAQPGETVGVYPGTWTIRGGKNCTKAREFLGANNLWGMLPPSFIPHHTIISDSLLAIHPTKQQPILTTYTTMQTTI